MTCTAPPRPFQSALSRHAAVEPALCLTHATRGEDLRGILRDGALATSKDCEVLHANVLFLFYGRPDYSPRDAERMESDVGRAPIVLLFDPVVIASAKFVHPFDTGALRGKRYETYGIKEADRSRYLLDNTVASPGLVVARFYEGNAAYFSIEPRATIDLSGEPAEMQCYHRLITHHDGDPTDSRRAAIEIAVASPLSLQGSVKAVILPAALKKEPAVESALRALKCEPYVYKTYGEFKWTSFEATLRDKVREFLVDEGAL